MSLALRGAARRRGPERIALVCAVAAAVAGCGSASKPDAKSPDATSPDATATSPASKPAVKPAVKPDAAVAAAPGEAVFPTFGIAFTPPEGWRAEPTQPLAGFLGRWLPADATDEDWSQFTLQVQPRVQGRTLRQITAPLERRGYTRTEARIAGGEALRLDLPADRENADRPLPSPVYVFRRGEFVWRLLFLLNKSGDRQLTDGVASSIRWLPLEGVERRLQLGQPQPLLGVGTIRVPAIARVETGSDEQSVTFTSFDYKADQDGIIIVCYRTDARPDDLLSIQATLYAQQIESRTGLPGVLRFGPVPGKPTVFISDPLVGEFPDGDDPSGEKTVRRHSIYAIWQASAEYFVRMQSVVNEEVFSDKAALTAAINAARASMASCAPKPRRRENGSTGR